MSFKLKNFAVIGLISVFVAVFSVCEIISTDKKISISERRPLSQLPELNAESLLNGKFMSEFEKYTLDQFPMREKFRSLKAVLSLYGMQKKDNNGIIFSNNYASKLDYPLNMDSLNYAAERIKYIYEKYLKDSNCKVYFSIIPDKNFFISKKEKIPVMDYDLLIDTMSTRLDFASYIDIFKTLDISDYFKTDTHWRQDKIEDTAIFLMKSMDTPYYSEYETILLDNPFYGVYYGQSALPLKPDELWYIKNDGIEDCFVFDCETDSYIPVYDMEKAYSSDPYEMFLSGSKSLLTIENISSETDKELIIFRDSFGSSIAPYFINSYQKITLVDTRYILPDMIGRFFEIKNSDVIFLYSTSLLNNSNTLK